MAVPNLRAVDATLPDPPYPADTKTKGWRFELDMQRILASDTWAITPPHLRGQLLLVWALSFEQRPPASWPNNHAIIAAHIGMEERQFSAHSDILMRGFILHSDDRLYHPIVVERVEKLIGYREEEKRRKAAYRAAKVAEKSPRNVPRVSHGTPVVSHGCPTGVRTQEQEQEQEQEPVLEEKKEKDLLRKSQKKTEKPKSPPTARGARLNIETLPADWKAWAKDKRPDLDPDAVFESFRDYWISIPGARGVKLDWKATWRNWVRTQRTTTSGPAGGFRTKAEIIAERNKAGGDAWLAQALETNAIDGEFERVES